MLVAARFQMALIEGGLQAARLIPAAMPRSKSLMANEPPKPSRGISTGGLIGGATAVATAIAAIVGMLNQLGYIGNHESASTAAVSYPAADSIAGHAPASSATLAMVEPKLSSMTGAWRDSGMGGCHQISQNGANLDITNYIPGSSEIMSHGDGTVTGTHVELRLKTMRGEFELSPDGRVIKGMMVRATGTRPSLWQYVGPACQKPG